MNRKPGPVRVLVVDDSLVVRELLREMLESSPDITVVGEAVNGRQGVEKVISLSPDLVTLDVRMPVMDGLEAVQEIMAVKPTPILIVTASLSKDELDVSFEAIHRGALDVMLKPSMESRKDYLAIRDSLIDRVLMLSRIRVISHPRRKPRKTRAIPAKKARDLDRAVFIGASLGGPAAVMTVLKALADTFPAPIFVVQHIAHGFSEGFTAWLDKNLPFEVRSARDKDRPRPGTVLVAPDNVHMAVETGLVRLLDTPAVHSCKPSVDVLFESAARIYGKNAIGVILTGMGTDGAGGASQIRKRGGHVLVQDEESCVVFGMPKAALEAGAANAVLPLAEIPEALVSLVLSR